MRKLKVISAILTATFIPVTASCSLINKQLETAKTEESDKNAILTLVVSSDDGVINDKKNLSVNKSTIYNPEILAYNGYHFAGWYYDKEYNYEIKNAIKIDTNTTIYASFEKNIDALDMKNMQETINNDLRKYAICNKENDFKALNSDKTPCLLYSYQEEVIEGSYLNDYMKEETSISFDDTINAASSKNIYIASSNKKYVKYDSDFLNKTVEKWNDFILDIIKTSKDTKIISSSKAYYEATGISNNKSFTITKYKNYLSLKYGDETILLYGDVKEEITGLDEYEDEFDAGSILSAEALEEFSYSKSYEVKKISDNLDFTSEANNNGEYTLTLTLNYENTTFRGVILTDIDITTKTSFSLLNLTYETASLEYAKGETILVDNIGHEKLFKYEIKSTSLLNNGYKRNVDIKLSDEFSDKTIIINVDYQSVNSSFYFTTGSYYQSLGLEFEVPQKEDILVKKTKVTVSWDNDFVFSDEGRESLTFSSKGYMADERTTIKDNYNL